MQNGFINRRGAETPSFNELTEQAIGINSDVPVSKSGIKCIANNFQDPASPRPCGDIKFG